MGQINFKDLNKLISMVSSLDEALTAMQQDVSAQEEEIRSAAASLMTEEMMDSLAQVPVEELRNAKAGIRVNALKAAGYQNLSDLARADDSALQAVNGIGEKQTLSIRTILAVFVRQLSGKKTIRLLADDDSKQNLRLIRAIAVFRISNVIRQDVTSVQEEFHASTQEILQRITVRGAFKWLFTGRRKKDAVIRAIEDLTGFVFSPLYERAGRLNSHYHELKTLSDAEAKKDFEQHGAEYYVILERIYGKAAQDAVSVSNIPAQLAADIDSSRIDMSCFTGTLRAYQEFGVKYILHQKRVLLGDDMGLGKTVQAVAAMSHLYAERKEGHFLIVCPASVLINWCREIQRFSNLPVWLLYGDGLEEAYQRWEISGGAAVVNYESMKKIIEKNDTQILLSMMIIDEAHYIKNPEAMRTQYAGMLKDKAENILLMTGTPLENRAEEMCSLIGFIRPDLSKQVIEAVSLSRTREFKEMISPVYLRRQRSEVLEELPPVEWKEQWCRLSESDRAAYGKEILERNFTGARRVGFLQEDMESSSKARRLCELCAETEATGRKAIVYSYFRDTIRKAEALLGDRCIGTITGSTPVTERQRFVDDFTRAPEGSVLICQVQAGGTGLNIQTASIVIFCEPQIKPSLIHQAVARVWRMGQVRNVQVHQLLCEDTVDEAVMKWLDEKQLEFDLYAGESVAALAADEVIDDKWIEDFMERERSRYLPAVIPQAEGQAGKPPA